MPLDTPSSIETPENTAHVDFRQLVDGMPTPYMVMDRRLRMIYGNTAYLETVERTLGQISGRYIFDVFPDTPERVASVRETFLRTLDGVVTLLDRQDFHFEHADGTVTTKCWQCVQTPYFDGAGNVIYIIQHAEDITESEKLRRKSEAISLELDHRVKNVFAVVQAVAALAGENCSSVQDFKSDFEARIVAMGRTHDSLSRTDWVGLSLREILAASIAQYGGLSGGRAAFHGRDAMLPPRASQLASLLGHEFATNAAKYGCFRHPGGRLDITCWPDPARKQLKVEWKESGMSGIRPPETSGFGTRLETFMPNVSIEREFEDDGIRITIRTTLPGRSQEYQES